MTSLKVDIPENMRREWQDLSNRQQRPLADVVSDSLRRYLAAEKFQSLRRRTLPFAEAEGYLTDEDVFEAIS